MWEHCGVVRSASGLEAGLDRIDEIEGTLGDVDVRPSSEGYVDLAHVLDLRAAIFTARATVLGALERRETRGCHNRSDYEKLDDAFDVNIRCAVTNEGELRLEHARVPEAPEELRRWATQAEELDVTGRLVE
jgi:succinate dehydrogenase / fumarate reductase flavoprotein subunit